MSKRCTEAFNEFLNSRLRSGHDGELEHGAAISFIHNKHKEIPQKIIKDFVTYKRHFVEAAKKQETTKDGAMNNAAGVASQNFPCNLGRGMGTFVELGGGHHNQSAWDKAQQRAALQAPAGDQLQNQGLIDLLRLKIASVRGQINIRLQHPPDSTGYITLAQLYREEAKLQQQLYKYLPP